MSRYNTLDRGLFVLICFLFATTGSSERNLSNEERLMSSLFDDHNTAVRPVIDSRHTVNVSIGFSLLYMQDLDLKTQVFTTSGLLIVEWTNEFLKWSPESFGELKEIIVDPKYIWTPELAVINAVNGAATFGDYSQFRAIVHNDGKVHWEVGGSFNTHCEIDAEYYPFDQQVCTIVLGPYSHWVAKANYTVMADNVNLDSYQINGEWELINTRAKRQQFSYECCPDEAFAILTYQVRFMRRPLFYVNNVVLPCILTSIILLLAFLAPPAEKLQICVLVFLSFQVLLLLVADKIPRTSHTTPLITLYIMTTMGIATGVIFLTLVIHAVASINSRPVPAWLNKLVSGLATVCCMHRNPPKSDFELNEGDTQAPETGKAGYQKAWKRVATILDRFLFLILLVVIIVNTCRILIPRNMYN